MSQLPTAPLANFAKEAAKHRQSRAFKPINGGILRFNGKTGEWSLGQEDIDVAGEELLIHTGSLSHGFIRWGEELPVTAYSLVTLPQPERPPSFVGIDDEGRPKTYHAQEARRFFGKFIDDELGQFTFETGSMGGVQRVDELMDEIFLRAQDDTTYLFPRVRLSSDHYKRSTGKVYKPVFEVLAWCDENGNPRTLDKKLAAPEVADDVDDTEDEAPAKTTRRRRRTAV